MERGCSGTREVLWLGPHLSPECVIVVIMPLALWPGSVHCESHEHLGMSVTAAL